MKTTADRALTSANPRGHAPALGRALGLFTATMLVAGGVIGSGIFRKPGVMAGQVGSPELLLLVWVIAGVITLFGALTNAEIAAMIPETGGQYVFFDRMYGPFVAFLYGWATFAVIQTGSIAAVSYVFAEYSTQFMALPELSAGWSNWSIHLPFIGDITPLREIGVKSIAVTVTVLLTVVNYVGVRWGGAVQNVVTVAKVAAMLALVAVAFGSPGAGQLANLTTDSSTIRPAGWAWWIAMAAAMQGAFWAYDGWNKITYVAGEIREPQRNLPRSLLWGMLLVTVLYLLASAAYSYVMPIDEMARSRLVAADAIERCIAGGGRWISAAVMLSTFGAANAMILASARVYYSMAHRGVFPSMLGRVSPTFATPGAALAVQAVWSVVLIFSGTFDMLTDTLIFVSWIFYAAGAYGVIVLRRKDPHARRPYRVPGYPWVPLSFVLFAAVYLVLTLQNDLAAYRSAVASGQPALINSLFGIALVLLGTPVYLFYRKRRKPD